MNETITKLTKLLPIKIKEGITKLEELSIDDPKFTTCLNNTLACINLNSKLIYKPEEQDLTKGEN